MALTLSSRAEGIVQAEIRVMTIECERVGGINLAQGVCDTGVPLPVMNGAKEAMDEGVNSYTRYDGLAELREAIATKMKRCNGIVVNPETEITVSAGSTGAFYCVCLALLDPGDEVILFEPYYGYHLNTLLAVGAMPKYVTMNIPEMRFTKEDLDRVVSPRTKAIMVCTPANPSGKVFQKEELDLIADVAVEHDLFVFTDEIYEYFVYDEKRHISPGSLTQIADRTVTVSGYSKTYSITGWRIGYSACRKKWAEMIGYINDLIYVCAPAPLQMGVASGIAELSSSYYIELCEKFKQKRDKLCSVLSDVGLKPMIPQGAYYILADATSLKGINSKEKAMFLLNSTGVASVPGSAFYHDGAGDNILRFCFAKNDDVIDDACMRMKNLNNA
jgi:aminotransferase